MPQQRCKQHDNSEAERMVWRCYWFKKKLQVRESQISRHYQISGHCSSIRAVPTIIVIENCGEMVPHELKKKEKRKAIFVEKEKKLLF